MLLVGYLLVTCVLTMATGAPPEFTTEEKEQLAKAFEALGTKPKFEKPEDLKQWMTGYSRAHGESPSPPCPSDAAERGAATRTTQVIHQPNIAPFFGEPTDAKSVSFETWKFEILSLRKEAVHPERVITNAAKKSLRGEASKVSRRLGVDATLSDILKKFEGIYGTVEDSESLLAQFYSAKQKEKEKVSTWGCRLEDLLDRAMDGSPLPVKSSNDMLRTKFWSGLLPILKDAVRHKFDTVADFDQLRVEARKVEAEMTGSTTEQDLSAAKPKKAQVKMTNATEDSSGSVDFEALKGMVCSLNTKFEEFQKNFNSPGKKPSNNTNRRRNRNGGNKENEQSDGPHEPSARPEVTCYRCGQTGHVRIGCRAVRTPEQQANLNSTESAAKGPQ